AGTNVTFFCGAAGLGAQPKVNSRIEAACKMRGHAPISCIAGYCSVAGEDANAKNVLDLELGVRPSWAMRSFFELNFLPCLPTPLLLRQNNVLMFCLFLISALTGGLCISCGKSPGNAKIESENAGTNQQV